MGEGGFLLAKVDVDEVLLFIQNIFHDPIEESDAIASVQLSLSQSGSADNVQGNIRIDQGVHNIIETGRTVVIQSVRQQNNSLLSGNPSQFFACRFQQGVVKGSSVSDVQILKGVFQFLGIVCPILQDLYLIGKRDYGDSIPRKR